MLRLYDFECQGCGMVEEKIVDTSIKKGRCDCGSPTKRIIGTPNINMGVGAYGYYDETLQTYVSTNKQRREECVKQDVTPQGDTPLHRERWV